MLKSVVVVVVVVVVARLMLQVAQLLLDFYLLSLPIALVNKMFVESSGVFQPWPMLGCFLITLFFQGLMR